MSILCVPSFGTGSTKILLLLSHPPPLQTHMQAYAVQSMNPPAGLKKQKKARQPGSGLIPPEPCSQGDGQEYGPPGRFCSPTHGNLAKSVCVLDIQWLLLMETLNPREHSFQSQMEFPFRKILAPVSSEQSPVPGRTWEGSEKSGAGTGGSGALWQRGGGPWLAFPRPQDLWPSVSEPWDSERGSHLL